MIRDIFLSYVKNERCTYCSVCQWMISAFSFNKIRAGALTDGYFSGG